MLKRIRRLYRTASNPLRRLWHWAKNGGNCRRAKRFDALARWAHKKRDKREKGSSGWKLWDDRRAVYHRKSEYYAKKCHAGSPGGGCTSLGDPCWGGCRQFTDQAIRIVGGRASVTSRKRWATFGNPGSDHYAGNLNADAVDFGIGNAHSLLDEVARAIVGRNVSDYENVYFTKDGVRYRFQGIAATHGTGPHLHIGLRRA